MLAENRGDYQASISRVLEAIAIDERSPHLWLYLADLYDRSGADKELQLDALARYLELKDDPRASERMRSLESGS